MYLRLVRPIGPHCANELMALIYYHLRVTTPVLAACDLRFSQSAVNRVGRRRSASMTYVHRKPHMQPSWTLEEWFFLFLFLFLSFLFGYVGKDNAATRPLQGPCSSRRRTPGGTCLQLFKFGLIVPNRSALSIAGRSPRPHNCSEQWYYICSSFDTAELLHLV